MTHAQIRRIYQLSIVLALLFALVIAWPDPQFQHGRLSGIVYDSLLPAPTLNPDNRIVIVDIDEESLQKVGRWPWPRATLAQLVEQLQSQQPAIIGLDILLPEPATALGDQRLKQQLAATNVVTAVTFSPPEPPPNATGPQPSWPISHQMIDLTPTLFSAGQTAKAHITPTYDGDGSIRRIHPVICAQHCYKTLSMVMLERLTGLPAEFVSNDSWLRNDQLCIGPYCQYIDASSYVWIPYHRNSHISRIPAWKLLAGESIPQLKGTLVLVGTSAVGLGDNVVTPLSPETPGVNIHATLLASWFDNYAWQPLHHQSWWQSLLVLVIALAALLGFYLRPLRRLLLVPVVLLAAAVPYLLINQGIWLNPLPAATMLVLCLIVLAGTYSTVNISERQTLYKAFGTYVPPLILKQLIKDRDDRDALAPQRAQITVIFADIQGFTRLCEQLAPEQVVEMTNHLFTELTDEIHRHHGTLDKYMGDCVMAFWGAPLKQPEHKIQALNCAIALQQRVNSLTAWLASKDLPHIQLSTALETGEVTVGNMGSRQRRAYTVMGHSVNLAAHLQTMTKQLHHNILIGPQLTAQLPNDRYRDIGQVEIKGISGKQRVSTAIMDTPPS